MTKRFVKARNTKVPVVHSQSHLEQILRRYGASGFGVSSDYERSMIRVFFRIPDAPGEPATVPVRLEVNVDAVLTAMHGPLAGQQYWTESARAQGERVAWRHLVDWVDAACSAASAGLQKMSEAFLAHTLVKGDDGAVIRVIDQLNGRGEWRALLPAGEVK